jgi:hypothetical protein
VHIELFKPGTGSWTPYKSFTQCLDTTHDNTLIINLTHDADPELTPASSEPLAQASSLIGADFLSPMSPLTARTTLLAPAEQSKRDREHIDKFIGAS